MSRKVRNVYTQLHSTNTVDFDAAVATLAASINQVVDYDSLDDDDNYSSSSDCAPERDSEISEDLSDSTDHLIDEEEARKKRIANLDPEYVAHMLQQFRNSRNCF